MILTTHALIGAAIGKHIHNPLILIAILIPLHYLMDIFRHGEYLNKKSTFRNTAWKVVFDLSFGFLSILTILHFTNITKQVAIPILAGAFISMFPDLLTLLYWKLNFKFLGKIYAFHQFVHGRFKDNSPEREWTWRNGINDIIFSIIAIILLIL